MIENDVQLIDLFDSPESNEEIIYIYGGTYYKYLNFDQANLEDYYKNTTGWWEQISELGLSDKTPKNKIIQHLEYRYATGGITTKKIKRLIDCYFFNGKRYEKLKQGEIIQLRDCVLENNKMIKKVDKALIGKHVSVRMFFREINTNLVRNKDDN